MEAWSGKNLNFLDGQIILVDKPYKWSSFDVVKKVRNHIGKKLGIKKIKVGHAGTLDPLATGLLIIATGKFTKKIDELMGLVKVYTGDIQVGATTPSFDLETEINETFSNEGITSEALINAKNKLSGLIQQVPPMFSAKKINGQRAYMLAREGKEIELKSREVNVTQFDIDSSEFPKVNFTIECSKGTYIRSIARDFGLELNSGGHLTSLRRESIGSFSVKESYTPDSFAEALNQL